MTLQKTSLLDKIQAEEIKFYKQCQGKKQIREREIKMNITMETETISRK